MPPVTFRSSLPTTPFLLEATVRVPVPLRVRSLLEKITPSKLVSPSLTKLPVTERALSVAVVTNTLSADFT